MAELTDSFLINLKSTIRDWHTRERPGDLLVQGEDLRQAKRWARKNALDPDEWAFIEASIIAEHNPLADVVRKTNHDLRGVLNNVLGYSDLLIDELDGQIDEMSYEDLKSIHLSAKQLLDMTTDFMDFAKLQSGVLEFEREPVDMKECFQAAMERLRKHIGHKSVQIERIIALNLPEVYGDPLRVEQIFHNLIYGFVMLLNQTEFSVEMKSVENVVQVNISTSGKSDKFEEFQRGALAFKLPMHFVLALGGTIHYEQETGMEVVFTLLTRVPQE